MDGDMAPLQVRKRSERLLTERQRGGIADTDLEISARIAKFDTVALLSPAEFYSLNNFRTAAGRVLRVVHSVLLPAFRSLPPDLLKQVAALQSPRD